MIMSIGINTRYRGQKHVRVYKANLTLSHLKSILKNVSYSKSMNSNLSLFRTLDKFAFHAHQKGLRNHKAICQKNLCDTCTYSTQVSTYTWDLKNYSRYLQPLVNKLQPNNLKQKKRVKFSNSDMNNKTQKGLNLDIISLARACTYNVSLHETRLLSC